LFVFYWLTFALIAFRLFVLIGQVAHTALLPSKRRLQGALACLGAGLGMVAGQSLVAYTQSRSHPFPLQGVVLLIVAGAFVITSVDLRRQKTV
jgi:peptidoglycan/LPS O-acetylase OafA/YrhL